MMLPKFCVIPATFNLAMFKACRPASTLLLLAVSACSHFSHPAPPSPSAPISPFAQALSQRYQEYAEQAHERSNGSKTVYRFRNKAAQVARGRAVQPELPESWPVRKSVIPALQAARQELLGSVTRPLAIKEPQMAADAYFLFDCWIDQETQWQETYLETCRNEFFEVLNQISLLAAAKKPAYSGSVSSSVLYQTSLHPRHKVTASIPFLHGHSRPVPAEGNVLPLSAGDYTVYFAFNSAELDAHGSRVLSGVALGAKPRGNYEITVGGHTDTVGSAAYNLSLSRDRAQTIRKALEAKGLSDAHIQIFGYGESDPAVATADEVREPKNRRAEITVK